MNKKIIISWILVILWACFIFYNSSLGAESSSKESSTVIENIVVIFNKIGITNIDLNSELLTIIVTPIRKLAHTLEYLVFIILLLIALNNSKIYNIKGILIAILICFIYACSDEVHQLFIPGRSGEFRDVMVDMIGGLNAVLIYYIMNKIIYKRNIFTI